LWHVRLDASIARGSRFGAPSENRADGGTWKTRPIPGIKTVGYVSATQAPNGIIHIVTSKSEPERHIELNEQWVFEGGPETAAYGGLNERSNVHLPEWAEAMGRDLQGGAQYRRRNLVERQRAQAVGAHLDSEQEDENDRLILPDDAASASGTKRPELHAVL
jgi:hypothetical protein